MGGEGTLGTRLQFFFEPAVLHIIDEEKRARADLYFVTLVVILTRLGTEAGSDGQCGRDREQYIRASPNLARRKALVV